MANCDLGLDDFVEERSLVVIIRNYLLGFSAADYGQHF
jgi:hypothetical protein